MEMRHPDKELLVVIVKSTYTGLSASEEQLLSAWLSASPANQATYEALTNSESLHRKMTHFSQRNANKELHFQTILHQISRPAPVRPIRLYRKWLAAAAILILLSLGTWSMLSGRDQKLSPAPVATATTAPAVVPGKTGAELLLSNGSVLVLDSLGNGIVANEEGADAELKDGLLAYHANGEATVPVFNTLRTPKGREFKIILPDGTAAWLNSASSLRFPTGFAAGLREVFITGEVYFEVAALPATPHHDKVPFLVHVTSPQGYRSTIEVRGTHFNVNAYTAVVATTLLEGSVQVSREPSGAAPAPAVVLKPGQQALVTGGDERIHTAQADTDKVMAWRRGFFNFDNASLREVMDQLARWYDLEAVYPQGAPAIMFQGEMSRGMQLASVLQALEESKVRFKLEGRSISILP